MRNMPTLTDARRNLFIAGGYSHGNPGDEAILKATLGRLRKRMPDAKFTVWLESHAAPFHLDPSLRAEFVHWDPLGWMYRGGFASKVAVKIYTDGYPLSWRLMSKLGDVQGPGLEKLRRADTLVMIGGGYLNSYYLLLKMHALAMLAKSVGTPLVLLGQTLGPFIKRQHRAMAEEIFHYARRIVLRDAFSQDEVAKHRGKILLGTDDAVGFAPRPNETDLRAVARALRGPADAVQVGVNLIGLGESRRHYAAIAAALSAFARALAPRPVRAVFVPMETSRYCDDRAEAALLSKDWARPQNLEFVVAGDLPSVESRYELIRRMDLFVGMRLHSLVFALSAGVPTVGLYHEEYYYRKIRGLFRGFGMEEFALPIEHSQRVLEPVMSAYRGAAELRGQLAERKQEILSEKEAMLAETLEEFSYAH